MTQTKIKTTALLRYVPSLFIVVWTGWLIGVLLDGVGLSILPFRKIDFTRAGQFGDAFGSLSGLMASLAAAGAWYAVILQRRAEDLSDQFRKLDDKNRRKQDFERNFFQLLRHLSQLVSETDIYNNYRDRSRDTSHVAKDAFRKMRSSLNVYFNRPTYDNQPYERRYSEFYYHYEDELSHYFRTLYHLCNYVEASEVDDKAFYMKIVFGQLSNSELILIGANCAFGFGRGKFASLIEKYAAMSNTSYAEHDAEIEIATRATLHSNAYED